MAVSGAAIQQTSGPDPKQLTIPPGQLTAPGNLIKLPVFSANLNAFEVETSLAVSFPKQQATLKANGRTGGPIVSFCPGLATPTAPDCIGSNGRLRYSKTVNQFGGPAQAAVAGGAKTVLRAGSFAPCNHLVDPNCLVITAPRTQGPAGGALGGAFGFVTSSAGAAPNPGLFNAKVAANGAVLSRTPTGLGPGLSNRVTNYGGPWTTGRVTVSVTGVQGLVRFTLTGSDNRVNGVGTISLVSGAISKSVLYGPQANRGWLNLTIAAAPPQPAVPALTGWGIGALALTLIGVGVRRIRRTAASAA